jgi:23S rRNA pseudouridine2605 synthase
MAGKAFEKFIVQKESGARKKERIRQEKKKWRQESKAYHDKKKQEARSGKGQKPVIPTQQSGKPSQAKTTSPEIVKKGEKPKKSSTGPSTAPAVMPLNKYIAHAGVCSRRDAAELVKQGKVTVNNTRILEPGFRVSDKDEVKVQGRPLQIRRNLVYILLNKPKDFITTTEDERGRKTVLDLVRKATPERVYPVGRLDRNTTGVLLLTNDGDLAQKLSHPSHEVKKVYEVTLDRQLSKKDFEDITKGITLEDGFIAPDALAWPDTKNKHIVGIEIHSGRNRIVRRIFEALGYEIKALDRVLYADLSKKNVERGKWRFLSEKEVRLLKYLNASMQKKPGRAIERKA